MKPETAQKIIMVMDILAIITLLFTIIFIWYFVEPIKVANNPFYAISKIPGATCFINGIIVSDFLKPGDLKYKYSDYLNITINLTKSEGND